MKVRTVDFLRVLFLFFLLISCKQEEKFSPTMGKTTFSLSPQARGNGRVDRSTTPAFVLLSVKETNGVAQENIKLSLYALGQSYLSESINLKTGNYQLTQFVVLDATNKIIYATPSEGSDLAKFVTDPLPIEFVVTSEGAQVTPQVLEVLEDDQPESFGYTTFAYEVVSSSVVVLIKTSVKIQVGEILYENLDALIRVSGYNSGNTKVWTKDYNYIGPEDNVLEVKNGFHHYSVELVDKWGIHSILTYISATHIWDGRADGPNPGTIALGGSKKAKKLLMYVESVQVNTPGTVNYAPGYRRLYTYNGDGRLSSIRYERYNTESSQFEGTQVEEFTYNGASLVRTRVRELSNGEYYNEYRYEYGPQDKIMKISPAGIVEWTAAFTDNSYTDPASNSITVEYFDNQSRSFFYEFNVLYNNRISHKELAIGGSGTICNQGTYTYDKNINPFQHLGYVDFNITHWSINNKLTENITHTACWFPARRIPVSYDYTYDQDGYPVKQITTYRSGEFFNTPPYRSQADFYYE
jgi:hypothetical protein